MNAIKILKPYKELGMWVFDDPSVGLVQEPFVSDADTIIDVWVAGFTEPEKGFRLMFSAGQFPNFQHTLIWLRSEMSGNTYRDEELGVEGWLCPALFKYFETPPAQIFVRCDELPATA